MDTRIQVPQSFTGDNQNSQPAANSPTIPIARPVKSRDLRLVVAKRFMRMLRLHDRARSQLLASHQPQPR